jgi:hypothetical protein
VLPLVTGTLFVYFLQLRVCHLFYIPIYVMVFLTLALFELLFSKLANGFVELYNGSLS